jgi:hypothetical protein
MNPSPPDRPLCKLHGKPILPSRLKRGRNQCWKCMYRCPAFKRAKVIYDARRNTRPGYRENRKYYKRSWRRKCRILEKKI